MIEFKAECGHTVRARNEDAGGVVNCSYCGQPANVPENQEAEDLGFLFDEEDLSKKRRAGESARPKSASRGGMFSRRRRVDEFNPFALVVKLCWGALLLTIVIVVGKMWVLPLFEEGGRTNRTRASRDAQRDDRPRRDRNSPSGNRRQGLTAGGSASSLYVSSTPPGAGVYVLDSSKTSGRGRINRIKGCSEFTANSAGPSLGDGTYVVELVFPWNDPKLTGYAKYTSFRRAIEFASDVERTRLVTDYFLPDEASAVFIDETDEQIFIVRQYRGVEVRNKRSKGVRSLFLPKILNDDEVTYAVKELVNDYISNSPAYAFDEKHVRAELGYYQVTAADQDFVVEALARIGVFPYVTEDHRTRLFKIGIDSGRFAMKVIREANE